MLGSAAGQESADAIWRAATDLSDPHNQAVLLKNINQLHTLRGVAERNWDRLDGIGDLTHRQYQEAMFWHQHENLRIARKAVGGLGAYELDLQRPAPDAGEWRVGSDTDFLVRRKDGRPVTLEDIQRVEAAYRQAVALEVRRRSGGAVQMDPRDFDTGTDFMVAHDATTDTEFNRIAEHFGRRDADTYSRVEAARVEAQMRTPGEPIDYRDAGMYVAEMVDQAQRKQRQIDRLLREQADAPARQRAINEARIKQLEYERDKYLRRINSVNSHLHTQARTQFGRGLRTPPRDITDMQNLAQQARENYAHTLGNVLRVMPEGPQARQANFILALQLVDLPAARRSEVLSRLDRQVQQNVLQQLDEFRAWRRAEREQVAREDVVTLRNFLQKTEFGQQLLRVFGTEIEALTTRPTESSRFLADVYRDLAATDRAIQNRAQSLSMWLDLMVQVRDAQSDAELAIALGRTLASKTYYGMVASHLYTGLIERDGTALTRSLILMLSPKTALPQVVQSIGGSVIDLTTTVLFDHQFMVLYVTASFDDDGRFTGLDGYQTGSDAVCRFFDDVLQPGGEHWVEGVFTRALALSEERNLSQEVLSGINAFGTRAFVRALESTVYGGTASFMGRHPAVQHARAEVATLTGMIDDFAEALGDRVPSQAEPGWAGLSRFEPAAQHAMRPLLEQRVAAWGDVEAALCAAVTESLESRHRAEQGLEGGDEAALALLAEVERLFHELDIHGVGMAWLNHEGTRNVIMRWLGSAEEQRIEAMRALQRYHDAYSAVHEIRDTVESLYRTATGGTESLLARPLTGSPPLTADPAFDHRLAVRLFQETMDDLDRYETQMLRIKREALNDNHAQLDDPFDRRIQTVIHAATIALHDAGATMQGASHARQRLYRVQWWAAHDLHTRHSAAFEHTRAQRAKIEELLDEFRAHYQPVEPALAILPPPAVIEERAATDTPYAFGLAATAIPPETVYVWFEDGTEIGRGDTLLHMFEEPGPRTLEVRAQWTRSDRVLRDGSATAELSVDIRADALLPELAIRPPRDLGALAEPDRAYEFHALRSNIPDDATLSWRIDGRPAGVGADVELRFSDPGPNIVELFAEWEVPGSWTGQEQVIAPALTVEVDDPGPLLAEPCRILLAGTFDEAVPEVGIEQLLRRFPTPEEVEDFVADRAAVAARHGLRASPDEPDAVDAATGLTQQCVPEILAQWHSRRADLEQEFRERWEMLDDATLTLQVDTGNLRAPAALGVSLAEAAQTPELNRVSVQLEALGMDLSALHAELASMLDILAGDEVRPGCGTIPPYYLWLDIDWTLDGEEVGVAQRTPDGRQMMFQALEERAYPVTARVTLRYRRGCNSGYPQLIPDRVQTVRTTIEIEFEDPDAPSPPPEVVAEPTAPEEPPAAPEPPDLSELEEQRQQVLDVCEEWTASKSGGYGTTTEIWDISNLPEGTAFDFSYNAMSVPDKFTVEYPVGNVVLDTGWRGSAARAARRSDLYPGGVTGPGRGAADDVFEKAAADAFKVTVYGPESGTAWNYRIRPRCQPDAVLRIAESPTRVTYGSQIRWPATTGGGLEVTRYTWQATPDLTFDEPVTTEPATRITFDRLGRVLLWAEGTPRDSSLPTVESQQVEIEVVPPRFELVFDPPDGQARVGDEVQVEVRSDPALPAELVDHRWVQPSARSTYTDNASRIGFTVGDGERSPLQDIPLHVWVRVPYHGDTLAEIQATYSGQAYEVQISEPVHRGPTPQTWDPERGGLVDVPRGQVVTGQEVRLNASVQPTPPGEVRYRWSVQPDGARTHATIGSSQTFSASNAGSYTVEVVATNAAGLVLGRGSRSVMVAQDQPPSAPATPDDAEPADADAQPAATVDPDALLTPPDAIDLEQASGRLDSDTREQRHAIEVPRHGSLRVDVEADPELRITLRLEDADGRSLRASMGGSTSSRSVERADLAPGTYYARVARSRGEGTYRLTTRLTAPSIPNDTGPNDSLEEVQEHGEPIPVDRHSTGLLGYRDRDERDTEDWFRFDIGEHGAVDVSVEAEESLRITLQLVDADGRSLRASMGGSTSSRSVGRADLAPGTYYVRVARSSGQGGYVITPQLDPVGYTPDREPNDRLEQAQPIALGEDTEGLLGYLDRDERDTEDWFRFETREHGAVEVSVNAEASLRITLQLYDADGRSLRASMGGSTSSRSVERSDLAPGTYFARVARSSGQGGYVITPRLDPVGYTPDREPNDRLEQAQPIALGEDTEGLLGYLDRDQRDTEDWFRFETREHGAVEVSVNAEASLRITLQLLDADGRSLRTSMGGSTSSRSVERDDLAPGTYYARVARSSGQGGYVITPRLDPVGYTPDREPNDRREDAQPIRLGADTTGLLGYVSRNERDTEDWFRVETGAEGALAVSVAAQESLRVTLQLFDADGRSLRASMGGSTSSRHVERNELPAGVYFIRVARSSGQGGYTVRPVFTPAPSAASR
ncbi:PKD domain-containing protein [Thioalkalivibrio paradoxus]|nr:PKD domain-containing protein [Thioalkalivibrio paradoxus]